MSNRHFVVVTLTALVSIFAASTQLSGGYSVNSVYALPILLSIWSAHPRSAYWVTGVSTVFVAISSFVTPVPIAASAVIFSRTVQVLTFWLTAFVIVRYRLNELMRQADVSARERAEVALRRSDRNLENIRHALDQSVSISTTDLDGRITYVNEEFCTRSGLSSAELVGQNHRVLNSGLHAVDFFKDMYTAIADGRVWRGEIRNRNRDGAFYWVDTTIVPVVDDVGRPHQYISVCHDITERKRAEAAFRDQEALARLGKLAAVVAHEVRNPLAGIRGAIQVIGRRLSPQTSEQAIIKEAVARIDTLNGIVEDLLLFARPNKSILGWVSVADVVGNTIALFSQDPKHAGVTVRIEPTDLIVNADAEQLKLVLFNLVINGAQAMQGSGEITISTRRIGAWDEILVVDGGPGIPDRVREHLFEPFFTTGRGGTGLGLVTARRILEAHGGTVRLECPPGKGTIAIVQLPARGRVERTKDTSLAAVGVRR